MTTLSTGAARELIYARFVNAWGTTSDYVLGNESFEPPENDEWVRLTVLHLDSGFETLGGAGNRRVRRRGSITAQIFVPVGTGMDVSDTLMTTIRDLFEGVSFGGVDCFNTEDREVGVNGSHHQRNLECFFAYEERK